MTQPDHLVATPGRADLRTGLFALAAALTLGSYFVANGIKDIKGAGDQVTVTGSAKRPIKSDLAMWKGTVSAQAVTPAVAAVDLRGASDRVKAFLTKEGFADSMIAVRPITTDPIPETTPEGAQTGRLLGYRLSQEYQVTSINVEAITKLAQRAGDLIAAGVPLSASPTEYLYTKLSDLRVALLEEATKDARTRAEVIAKASGGAIGGVREARMGVFQITPRNSTDVSDYGVYDLTSVDKDVTAVVRVTFAVK